MKVEFFSFQILRLFSDTLKTCQSAVSIRMLEMSFLANPWICNSAFKIAYGGY